MNNHINVHPPHIPPRWLPFSRNTLLNQSVEEKSFYSTFDHELSHLHARLYLVRNADKQDNLDDMLARADILLRTAINYHDFNIVLELCNLIVSTKNGVVFDSTHRSAANILNDLQNSQDHPHSILPEVAMLPSLFGRGSIMPCATIYREKFQDKRQYISILFTVDTEQQVNSLSVQSLFNKCIQHLQDSPEEIVTWNHISEHRLHRGKMLKPIKI